MQVSKARLDKYGFARGHCTRSKSVYGFQTGDRVKATVLKSKKLGSYAGRVAVRASGNFNIQTRSEVIQGISHRYCELIQCNDGYSYSLTSGAINGNSRDQVGSKARIVSLELGALAPALVVMPKTGTQSALYLPGIHA